jgi:replication-associated recombination protein RarA
MSESLSELLRPKTFADLLQPEQIVDALSKIASRKSMVNMLFYGSPGIGKTSAARISLNATGDNFVEFNGSRDIGSDLVKRIEQAAGSSGVGDGPRICFIDEADKLFKKDQIQLRGIIENAGRHSRFLLTANNIRQFDRALKSRCMPICFDIPALMAEEVIARVLPRYIARLRDLGVSLEERRIEELFRLHFPDLRALANRIELEAMCSDASGA